MNKEIKCKSEQDWLDIRKSVLTATEVSCILGLNPFSTAKKMWAEKLNSTAFTNLYVETGKLLEASVVTTVNSVLQQNFKLYENGGKSFFIDEDNKIGATPDAGNGELLLECKTTRPGNILKWAYNPPVYYLVQLYIQLLCVGRTTGLLACLGTDFTVYNLKQKPDLICFELSVTDELTALILTEVKRFWETVGRQKDFRSSKRLANYLTFLFNCSYKKVI